MRLDSRVLWMRLIAPSAILSSLRSLVIWQVNAMRFKKRAHDPNALYDAYDESDDTEEKAKSGYLKGVGR